MKVGKKKIELSTTQIVALSFLLAIIVGTILLKLPISSKSGEWTNTIDALFMATTSVCVTGLVTKTTAEYWSTFGQVVILILIQMGGLGIISFTTSFILMLGKRVSLKDRLLLEDAFNLNTLSGLVKFLKWIFKGTFFVEGLGALGYMIRFIPQYGPKGIWYSVFTAISAFCNAGIDILGSDSLAQYAKDPWVNFVTMTMIIMGGLGFIVWQDCLGMVKQLCTKEVHPRYWFRKLKLHTKIVLALTVSLILLGTAGVFILEYNNMDTIGSFTLGEKLLASLFQSVTTRTAGFLTVSQAGLKDSTAWLCLVFMYIGGSPVGTAGGIKTVTIAILFLAALSIIKGNENVTVFGRRIPQLVVRKSIAVVGVSVLVLFLATLLMTIAMPDASLIDILYETTSAIATVGLSRDLTGQLNVPGQLIIITLMYLGRIGPISMAIAINMKKKKSKIILPKEDVTVG